MVAVPAVGSAAEPSASVETDEEPSWPIQEVVVYNGNQAQVTRTRTLELAADSNRALSIADLPGKIVRGSLTARVQGEDVRLQGVTTERQQRQRQQPERAQALRDEIDQLEQRRARLRNRQSAAQKRLAFLDELAKLPEEASESLLQEVAFSDFGAFLQWLEDDGIEVRDRIDSLQGKLEGVEERLADLRQALEQLGESSGTSVAAHLQLQAQRATQATVTLSYRIQGARWQPVYTARLDTEAETVRLERSVQVRQRTGEPWEQVTLRLATGRPAIRPPSPLETWWVQLQTDGPKPRTSAGAVQELGQAQRSAGGQHAEADAASSRSPVQEQDTGFTTTYEIDHPVSLPANNEPRTYQMAARTLEATLQARVIPQKRQRGWLYAQLHWPGENPLPAGTLTRYRDGTYIGKDHLAVWSPETRRTLNFGVDQRLDVTYHATRDQQGQSGWFGDDQRLERRYELSLHNQHREGSLPVQIRYRIPTSRNEELRVEPAPGMAEPDERQVDGKKGVWAWNRELSAGEHQQLELGFDLISSQDVPVQGL